MLPLLRLSWLSQSVQFVAAMPTHFYKYYQDRAVYEQTALFFHWVLVIIQLYMLPDVSTRLENFETHSMNSYLGYGFF